MLQIRLISIKIMKIIVVSGGFDPIHSGHIAYLKSAKKLGDKLIVLLNSDEWLRRKKEKETTNDLNWSNWSIYGGFNI